LRPPVGLLAVHDYRARLVLEACAALGLRVPDDVAVIGVDDDVVACELAEPPLSSVALPGADIGMEAARLLDHLMRGGRPPAAPVLLPPTGVVARRSTDVVAFEDQVTRDFVALVRTRLREVANVALATQALGVSRRELERRVLATLGVTPLEHLLRARVAGAKELLVGPEGLSLGEVARRCGFSGARHMNAVFRRLEGLAPAVWRASQKGRSPTQKRA
jgi:LacI family transcriptional regulator